MCNKFLVLSLILILASGASALPTGPGGTLYVGSMGYSTSTLVLINGSYAADYYYVQVDSAWHAVTPSGAGGATVQIATVTNGGPGSYNNNGEASFWDSPEIYTSGGGAPGGATLMVGAYYNNSPATTGAHNTDYAQDTADFLQLKAGGAITISNDGFIGTGTAPRTLGAKLGIFVDSSFMPAVTSANGNKNQGWITTSQQGGNVQVWQDTDGDGKFDDQALPGFSLSNIDGADLEYVKGKGLFTSSRSNIMRRITWDGAAYTSTVIENNSLRTTLLPSANALNSLYYIAAGAITPSKYDLYYLSGSSICHAIEGTDGTINGVNDVTVIYDENSEAGTQLGGAAADMELVKCPDGQYVLLVAYNSRTNTVGQQILVLGLDSSGNWNTGLGSTVLITSGVGSGTSTASPNDTTWPNVSDGRLDSSFGSVGIEFDAVPEPATVLLVGTGMLSLAGVLRRRMMR